MVDNVRTPQTNKFAVPQTKRDYFGSHTVHTYFDDVKFAMEFAEKNKVDSIYNRSEVCNNPEDGGYHQWRNALNLECIYKDGTWWDVDWKHDICGKYTV